MFKPCGDTIIVEKEKDNTLLELPANIEFHEEDIFIVKDVGVGYITEQGVVIPPEVKIGDRVIIKGKIVKLLLKEGEILLARAQDVIAYERSN